VTGPHVLNRHHYRGRPFPPGSLYVGRPGRLAREIFAAHPEIGDGTALGNPYTVQRHGEAALDLYRRWLWEQIKREAPAVIAALDRITEETSLVCSCVRKDGGGPCHAKVIAAAWRWRATTPCG
jgi:hypothetical protein